MNVKEAIKFSLAMNVEARNKHTDNPLDIMIMSYLGIYPDSSKVTIHQKLRVCQNTLSSRVNTLSRRGWIEVTGLERLVSRHKVNTYSLSSMGSEMVAEWVSNGIERVKEGV